jgi:hypothetical protein
MSILSATNNPLAQATPRRRDWRLRLSVPRQGTAFGIVIVLALVAFEVFNYSTTQFALADLLGNLRFLGIPLATVLAMAFCGMDFGGLARLFSPREQSAGRLDTWYLLSAWFLAGMMNAVLTWWSVSLAALSQPHLGNGVLTRQEVITLVPIFVAVVVWLIRILLIGTFAMEGRRLFATSASGPTSPCSPSLRAGSGGLG